MAPTKTDTTHGSLYDLFPEHSTSQHGGARFDEGFGLQDKSAGERGRNYDQFGTPASASTEHGQVWDEWGWKDMPELHGGLLFDEGFGSPSANETSRGPLFDLFQPSTQVKFIFNGSDSEGIVDRVTGDGTIMVAPRGGGNAVEVGLEQFLAYKSPSVDQATTVAENSQAEAPSAWNSDAHGAGRTSAPDTGSPIDHVAPGPGNPDARQDLDADWSITDHLKTLLAGDDVAKDEDGWDTHARSAKEHLHMAMRTATGGKPHFDRASTHLSEAREHHRAVAYQKEPAMIRHRTALRNNSLSHAHESTQMGHVAERASGGDVHHAGQALKQLGAISGVRKTASDVAKTRGLPSDRLAARSEWAGVTTVAKDVGVAEVAIQSQEGRSTLAGAKGAGSYYCGECREPKGKLTEDGRCPDCNTVIKAHEDKGPVAREKGDGNGSSEDSAGEGVADKTFGSIDDLRKAFGAGGDQPAGGQSVTLTGQAQDKDDPDKGQAKSDPEGEDPEERPHSETDHHSQQGAERVDSCPHCGQAIAELEAKGDEGAPSNTEPGGVAHKCLGSFLETLRPAPAEKVHKSAFGELRGLVTGITA